MMKKKYLVRAVIILAVVVFSVSPKLALGDKPVALRGLDVAMGKALFDRLWTSAPASTDATDGLGPLFNARSCAACHPRGTRSIAQLDLDGGVVRSGVTAKLGDREGSPDPVYGRQLQSNAVQGLAAEGTLVFDPKANASAPYRIQNLSYGPLASSTQISGRLAPTLLGSGLLDAVTEESIRSHTDPDDRNKDGISGRLHWVTDEDGSKLIGRFGWKASQPTLTHQVAGALHFDMGLSSKLNGRHEGDCTLHQTDCIDAPHGNSPRFDDLEVGTDALRVMVAYTGSLSPAKGVDHPGQGLFKEIGCASCHVPSLETDDGSKVQAYSNLLLHDMGPMLDDGVGEGNAAPNEWRTAPLWGIGSVIEAGTGMLHDGRAKTVEDVIKHHGGEATQSRERYFDLSDDQRQSLINFLKSL